MRIISTRGLVGAAALALLAVGAAAPSSVSASTGSHGGGGGGEVRAAGSCSAASTWKLKAKPDDDRVELEYEVDSNVAGQTWQVRVTDNGGVVVAGPRRTAGPSGSFSVEQTPVNRPGADRILATATNSATGETCRGTVVLPG